MFPNASKTASKIMVEVPPNSPQGIEGTFPLWISGYEWAMSSCNIEREKIGLIVKVSGYHPRGRQKPEVSEYGCKADGCQPAVIHYPISHENYWKARPDLSEEMSYWWTRDHAVLFHCNKGEVRAPAAACVMMGYISRRDPVFFLPVVLKAREEVDQLLWDIHRQVNILGDHQWFASQWDNYVIQCRLMGCQARWKDFRAYYKYYRHCSPPRDPFYGSTPRGTPTGAVDPREQRLQFDNSTPRGVANPSGGRSPRVNNPEYRPLWEYMGIDHPHRVETFPPPPSTPPPATGSATPSCPPPGRPLGGLGSAGQWLAQARRPHEKVYQKPRSQTPTPRGDCQLRQRSRTPTPREAGQPSERSPVRAPSERSRTPTPRGHCEPLYSRPGAQPNWSMDGARVDAGLTTQDSHKNDSDARAGLQTRSFADEVAAVHADRFGGATSSGHNPGDEASQSEVTFMHRPHVVAPHGPASSDDEIPMGFHPVDAPRAHHNPAENPAAVHYDQAPNKVRAIEDAELSDDMKFFLECSHWRGPAEVGKRMWRYNEVTGKHPLHTMCDIFGGRPLEQLQKLFLHFKDARGLATPSRTRADFRKWMKLQWTEAVKHSSVEYGGKPNMRTMRHHPPNNTALMMMAKSEFREVDADEFQYMICQLLEAGGDEFELDTNRTNAFMHSCGSGNKAFFMYFWDRAEWYHNEKGFPFDHRNRDGRNALDMCRLPGGHTFIYNKCVNLVDRRFMTYSDHGGGRSSANQRDRSLSTAPGTMRDERRWQKGDAHYRGYSEKPVGNRQRWRSHPRGGQGRGGQGRDGQGRPGPAQPHSPRVAFPVPALTLGAVATQPRRPGSVDPNIWIARPRSPVR